MDNQHYLALVCAEFGQTVRTIQDFLPEARYISDSQDMRDLGLSDYSSCFVWNQFILALGVFVPYLFARFDVILLEE